MRVITLLWLGKRILCQVQNGLHPLWTLFEAQKVLQEKPALLIHSLGADNAKKLEKENVAMFLTKNETINILNEYVNNNYTVRSAI